MKLQKDESPSPKQFNLSIISLMQSFNLYLMGPSVHFELEQNNSSYPPKFEKQAFNKRRMTSNAGKKSM